MKTLYKVFFWCTIVGPLVVFAWWILKKLWSVITWPFRRVLSGGSLKKKVKKFLEMSHSDFMTKVKSHGGGHDFDDDVSMMSREYGIPLKAMRRIFRHHVDFFSIWTVEEVLSD